MCKYTTFYFWYHLFLHHQTKEEDKLFNIASWSVGQNDSLLIFLLLSAEGTIERHASTLHFRKVRKHTDTEALSKALEVR